MIELIDGLKWGSKSGEKSQYFSPRNVVMLATRRNNIIYLTTTDGHSVSKPISATFADYATIILSGGHVVKHFAQQALEVDNKIAGAYAITQRADKINTKMKLDEQHRYLSYIDLDTAQKTAKKTFELELTINIHKATKDDFVTAAIKPLQAKDTIYFRHQTSVGYSTTWLLDTISMMFPDVYSNRAAQVEYHMRMKDGNDAYIIQAIDLTIKKTKDSKPEQSAIMGSTYLLLSTPKGDRSDVRNMQNQAVEASTAQQVIALGATIRAHQDIVTTLFSHGPLAKNIPILVYSVLGDAPRISTKQIAETLLSALLGRPVNRIPPMQFFTATITSVEKNLATITLNGEFNHKSSESNRNYGVIKGTLTIDLSDGSLRGANGRETRHQMEGRNKKYTASSRNKMSWRRFSPADMIQIDIPAFPPGLTVKTTMVTDELDGKGKVVKQAVKTATLQSVSLANNAKGQISTIDLTISAYTDNTLTKQQLNLLTKAPIKINRTEQGDSMSGEAFEESLVPTASSLASQYLGVSMLKQIMRKRSMATGTTIDLHRLIIGEKVYDHCEAFAENLLGRDITIEMNNILDDNCLLTIKDIDRQANTIEIEVTFSTKDNYKHGGREKLPAHELNIAYQGNFTYNKNFLLLQSKIKIKVRAFAKNPKQSMDADTLKSTLTTTSHQYSMSQ
ncbi:MAG: hypothetical protein HRT35_14830 [Algicola sp.]|nr:hypothetical protein [Algicola sp.]